MMKECRAGGVGLKEGEEADEGDSNETIFFRSEELIKAVCLQYQDLSAEKGGSVRPLQMRLEWHGWRKVLLADRAGGEGKKRGGAGKGGSVSGVETASVDVAGSCGSPGAPGVAWQLRHTWTGAEAQEASAEPDSHKGQQMKALLCGDEEKQRLVEKVKTHKHKQKHTRRCSEIQKHPCKRLLKLFCCHYQVPSSPKDKPRKLKIEL